VRRKLIDNRDRPSRVSRKRGLRVPLIEAVDKLANRRSGIVTRRRNDRRPTENYSKQRDNEVPHEVFLCEESIKLP
jgi:hypothetical protein